MSSPTKPGYKFEKIEEDGTVVTFTLSHTDYNMWSVVDRFKQFLLGCGFHPVIVAELAPEDDYDSDSSQAV